MHMSASTLRRLIAGVLLSTTAALVAACGGASDPTVGGGAVEPATPSVVASAAAGTSETTATTGAPSATGGSTPSTAAVSAPSATATTTTPPTTGYTVQSTVPLPTPVALPFEEDEPEPVIPLGRIAIPAIGIDAPMFDGIRLPTFDMGPGHWPGSAMPGQLGNVVIGGHRTESNADFGDLDVLAPGDEVIMTDNSGASFTYLVQSTEIIDPFAATIIYQTREMTATLFACHPKGSTDQRIVVRLTLAA